MRIPSTVVCLGDLLEIEFSDGRLYKPKRGNALLCSSANGRSLWIFANDGKWVGVSGDSRAHGLYRRWSSFEPDKSKVVKVKNPSKMVRAGRVKNIVYSSDKWSKNYKKIDYIHTFNRNRQPTISVDSKKNPSVIRIAGGNLDVRNVGITG